MPMADFTLNELASFSQNEKALRNAFLNNYKMIETPQLELAPKAESLAAIMAYNKAISIRKSSKLNLLTMLLN